MFAEAEREASLSFRTSEKSPTMNILIAMANEISPVVEMTNVCSCRRVDECNVELRAEAGV